MIFNNKIYDYSSRQDGKTGGWTFTSKGNGGEITLGNNRSTKYTGGYVEQFQLYNYYRRYQTNRYGIGLLSDVSAV